MLAAMHLIVLVSLFAVTGCAAPTISSITEQVSENTISAAPLPVTTKQDIISSTVKSTNSATSAQNQTTANLVTIAVTKNVSVSASPNTSSQRPNRTEEADPSRPPQTTATNYTTSETVSHGSTLPPTSESAKITETTTINKTSSAPSNEMGKGDLATNPGLVAILCIFCIILVLMLVVATIKCIQSPRSNFERLDDVQMGTVNEELPFAHYSK